MAAFEVPAGSTVRVRIVDSTSRITLPVSLLMGPPLAPFKTLNRIPSWSFLVEHTSSSGTNSKLLFDLGVPKAWDHMAAAVVRMVKANGWGIEVEHDVPDILEAHGVGREEINYLVWSHWHWDHIGDPALFPPSTTLVVGPGFKEHLLPAYPANDESHIRESYFANRTLREQTFSGLKIGSLDAHDFFGDGSFYLLSTPGHTVGHLSGLARTSTNPDTFVFMGGDLCHHGGEIRPSPHLHLPAEITPPPLASMRSRGSCPGALFEEVLRKRGIAPDKPFFVPTMGHDIPEVIRTIEKTQVADADQNVFFISAHDDTLEGVVDLFPKDVNAWKVNGWAQRVKWGFLKDFEGAEGLDPKSQL